MRSGAGLVCDWLRRLGVRHVFTVPGAQIIPLLREVARRDDLRVVAAAQELAAAYMADGAGRAGDAPGVCLSGGGPGALNMLGGARTAHEDRGRVLYVTGDVPAALGGRGAFQDAGPGGSGDSDHFRGAGLLSVAVESVAGLPDALGQIERELGRGRCAHVRLPVDVQSGTTSAADVPPPPAPPSAAVVAPELLDRLRSRARVLVLAGPGVARRAPARALRRLAEGGRFPVVTTLAAKGALPEDHPLSLGNCGFGGARRANRALTSEDVELLLALGAELDERETLAWDDRLRRPGLALVTVNDGPRRRAPPWEPDLAYEVPDLAAWIDRLAEELSDRAGPGDWWASPGEEHAEAAPAPPRPGTLRVGAVSGGTAARSPPDTALVADAGTVRVFCGQHWRALRPASFFGATRLGPMGWGVAAAVGIRLAGPDRPVIGVVGDGSMLMNGTELCVAATHRIAVLYVLLDNGSLASVSRHVPHCPALREVARLPAVDWPAFARALGARARTLASLDELGEALREGLGHPGPFVLHVRTDPEEPYRDPEGAFLSFSSHLRPGDVR